MYCSNCGKKFNQGEKYCAACGTINAELNKVQAKNNYSKVILIILGVFLVIGVLVISSINYLVYDKTHKFTKDDYLNKALKGNRCSGNNCLTKDDLEIISEETFKDSRKRKLKRITFRIKDTDLTFDVEPEYGCGDNTFCIDGSCGCFIRSYYLNSNYNGYNYTLNKFNQKINYDDRFCQDKNDCIYKSLYISKRSDIEGVVHYLYQFLDYVNGMNNSEKKIFNAHNELNIQIVKTNFLDVDFIEENGVYHIKFEEKYKPEDGKLETYINNFINAKNIELGY